MSVALDRFEHGENSGRIVLDADETIKVTAVFKLLPGASTELEQWSFQISETGRWPATIGLTGSTESNPALEPLVFADSSDGATDFVDSQLVVLDSENSLDYRGYRAFRDEHIATFVVEVSSISGDTTVQFDNLVTVAEDEEFWQLAVGDETKQARQVEVRDQSQASTTFIVVFTYPSVSTDLTLFGDGGQLELAELVVDAL